jgi:hypothetical protein
LHAIPNSGFIRGMSTGGAAAASQVPVIGPAGSEEKVRLPTRRRVVGLAVVVGCGGFFSKTPLRPRGRRKF